MFEWLKKRCIDFLFAFRTIRSYSQSVSSLNRHGEIIIRFYYDISHPWIKVVEIAGKGFEWLFQVGAWKRFCPEKTKKYLVNPNSNTSFFILVVRYTLNYKATNEFIILHLIQTDMSRLNYQYVYVTRTNKYTS